MFTIFTYDVVYFIRKPHNKSVWILSIISYLPIKKLLYKRKIAEYREGAAWLSRILFKSFSKAAYTLKLDNTDIEEEAHTNREILNNRERLSPKFLISTCTYL